MALPNGCIYLYLRFVTRLPLAPHKYEAMIEGNKVLRDTAPLSEYGLGLKFTTMHAKLVPRVFPQGSNPESDKLTCRAVVDELVDSIIAAKVNLKKQVKEQYCRDIH